MKRKEELKAHTQKMLELKTNLQKAEQEWIAYNKLFLAWLGTETGIAGEGVHLTDVLSKWDETNDNAPKANN